MQFVESELDNSCIISALAAITDQTFNEVLEGMREYWNNEGEYGGVDDPAWVAYLAANGYAIQDISHEYVPHDCFIDEWPIPPFAPAHLVFVYSDGPHGIAMDANGRVYDGNDPNLISLSQYKRVYRIVGIWPVGKVNLKFKNH